MDVHDVKPERVMQDRLPVEITSPGNTNYKPGAQSAWPNADDQSAAIDSPPGPTALFRGLLPQSFSDYRGKIAAVLFTGGCNLRCRFCYNKPLVLDPGSQESISSSAAIEFLSTRVGFLDAVVITGGEPTIHEWIPDFIRQLRKLNLLVGLDTNGTNPAMVKQVLSEGLVDRIAVDYKAPRLKYNDVTCPLKTCSIAWQSVVETLKIITTLEFGSAHKYEYEVRLTLHPDLHPEKDIFQMGKELEEIGVRRIALQTFKPWEVLDESLNGSSCYSREKLEEFVSFFRGHVIVR